MNALQVGNGDKSKVQSPKPKVAKPAPHPESRVTDIWFTKNDEDWWEVQLTDVNLTSLFFAEAKSLDECLAKLAEWRKGVVSV